MGTYIYKFTPGPGTLSQMNPLLFLEIEKKRSDLSALCRRYGVISLDLFGSGSREDWTATGSDLDFIVDFAPDTKGSIADRYLALAEGLEALFARPVDLLTPAAIRNPYFKLSVEATRSRLYAK